MRTQSKNNRRHLVNFGETFFARKYDMGELLEAESLSLSELAIYLFFLSISRRDPTSTKDLMNIGEPSLSPYRRQFITLVRRDLLIRDSRSSNLRDQP